LKYLLFKLVILYLLHLQIIIKCYCQAAWIVDDTDDEDNDSDNDNQPGSGMVIDEQGHSDQGSDGSDIDAVSHFTEKFDGETIGDTEMAVSFLCPHLMSFMHFKALACNIGVQCFTSNQLYVMLCLWAHRTQKRTTVSYIARY
jgi:hypothetical protein